MALTSLKRRHIFAASSLIAILGLLSVAYFWPRIERNPYQANAQAGLQPDILRLHGSTMADKPFAWASTIGWVQLAGEAHKCSGSDLSCSKDSECYGNWQTCDDRGGAQKECSGSDHLLAPVFCIVAQECNQTCVHVADYGVSINVLNSASDYGIFSADSWAWSYNAGWVAFHRIKVCSNNATQACSANVDCGPTNVCLFIKPPVADPADNGACGSGCQGSDNPCLACIKKDGSLHGWAYVLAMGDLGWIRLDASSDSAIKALSYDPASGSGSEAQWGQLAGYGWGGFQDADGVGWLSFNSANRPAVAGVSYLVSGQPAKAVFRGAVPTEGLNTTSLTLGWNLRADNNTTWFNVWRREGKCSNSADVCDDNSQCNGGTCGLGNFHQVNTVPIDNTNAYKYSFVDNSPALAFNRTYHYRIAACNIFGCNLTGADTAETVSQKTSPLNIIPDLKVNPICVGAKANTSYVDLLWSPPYIADRALGLATYEIQYCVLSPGQTSADCQDWRSAGIGGTCQSPARGSKICNGSNPAKPCSQDSDCGDPAAQLCIYSAAACRDEIDKVAGERFKDLKNYQVYRLRAVANDGPTNKICTGGSLALRKCALPADCQDTCVNNTCAQGGIACINSADCEGSCDDNPSKSTWVYSKPFRICTPSASYNETRPQ